MTYKKTIWKDQDVQNPRTYDLSKNEDNTYKLMDAFGNVVELGTPVNAVNMNNIEEGIAGCAIRHHNLKEEYIRGEWVLGTKNGETKIYQSLHDNNLGNDLSDSEHFETVNLSKKATSESIGSIQPDNKTTFVDENGTLSAPKYSLFDLVQKDHILAYEEKEGLEKLGEYVYKTGSSGTRYGYSDFYEKCLSEFKECESYETYYVESNIENNGCLDIKGVISGFSTDNYARINKPFCPTESDNWEFVLKVYFPDSATTTQIIGTRAKSSGHSLILEAYQGQRIRFYASSNGTSWDISNATLSANSFEKDKEYLIKIQFDGEKYTVDLNKLKNDKETYWENFVTVEKTNTIYGITPILGLDNTTPFTGGEIDLNKSYIKLNNEIWWQGVTTIKCLSHKNGHKFYSFKDEIKKEETPNVVLYDAIAYDNKKYTLNNFAAYNYAQLPFTFVPEDKTWELKLNFTTGDNVSTQQRIFNSTVNVHGFMFYIQSAKFYFPYSINNSSWAKTGVGTYTVEANTEYYVKIKFDGEKYVLSYSKDDSDYTDDITMENTSGMLECDYYFGISEGHSYPFLGSINLKNCNLTLNNELIWQGVEEKEIVRENDKLKIDKIYQTTGAAWFYGIDEENERILLPRNDFFFQNNEEAGKYIEAGLPDHSHEVDGFAHSGNQGGNVGGWGLGARVQTADASKSNPIYGNSNTVQPPSVSVVTYMVVGNVPLKQAKTNIIDVTISENDTIPIFTGQYFDFKPNHISWIKAGEVADGNIYKSAYSELVKILNGEETKYGEGFKVVKENEKDPDINYSEYWVINEDEMTFKAPLKTSFLNTISNARILIDKKEATDEDKTWYNLYSDGWLEQGGYLPIPLSTNAQKVTVHFEKPFKDTNYYFNRILDKNELSNSGNTIYIATHNEKTASDISFYAEGTGYGKGNLWFASGYSEPLTAEQITKSESTNLYFKVANAIENLEIIDCGEVLEALNNTVNKTECKAYIVKTYQNDNSGYVIYSNGYCKQWGKASDVGTVEVTLLMPFKDSKYIVFSEAIGSTDVAYDTHADEITSLGFKLISAESSKHETLWQAQGFLQEGTY